VNCFCPAQARDLVPRDFSGTADPFCRLRLLWSSTSSSVDRRRSGTSSQLQSRVHRKTVCPEFEESFVFDVGQLDLAHRTLEILVYDYDQFSKDECVGQVLYPLDQVAVALATMPPSSVPNSGTSASVSDDGKSGSVSTIEPIVVWKGLSAYDKKSDVSESII
jgi:Ca2+-dependent lipid-binding protein